MGKSKAVKVTFETDTMLVLDVTDFFSSMYFIVNKETKEINIHSKVNHHENVSMKLSDEVTLAITEFKDEVFKKLNITEKESVDN